MMFEIFYFVISLHFPPFDTSNPFVLQMCFIRITIAYMYPKIINFDAVDFSECGSEVISFQWRIQAQARDPSNFGSTIPCDPEITEQSIQSIFRTLL